MSWEKAIHQALLFARLFGVRYRVYGRKDEPSSSWFYYMRRKP